MSGYDFRNLNDKEFEILVNDILSQREGAVVDRFKAGKDGGIDGRFFAIDGTEVIIQSKHWIKTGVTALIKHLGKIELKKVKKLNPSRYILVTSLELSNANKTRIKATLAPYIISKNDILGQENLNDLLSANPEIEQKHYKLWISSSNVLKIILSSALTGRSEAKCEEIIESAKLYVLTDNHGRALEKLKETHTVVITGEAGIGKTSLADQLAHHYIAQGFELCVIEDDISEAEAKFTKKSKQVFYFDDFLGRNYLTALQGRKDSRIMNFIERVARDSSKRFILTSRTTILSQGKTYSDLFNIGKIDEKEYEITIQSLSTMDKAKILYNHIWFGKLSEHFVEELYFQRRYFKIVVHRNFNPRLISFITDSTRVAGISSNEYWAYVQATLQNPKGIWADVYDNQLDDLIRLAICLVVFNGGRIDEEDFQEAFFDGAITNGLASKSNVNNRYVRTIRSSLGAVLNRIMSEEGEVVRLDLFNPSLADFILERYVDDNISLEAFFICLNTVSSVQNFENLKRNGMLGNDGYSRILEKLGSEKINVKHLQRHSVYTLTLARMLIHQNYSVSPEIVRAIVRVMRAINSVSVPVRCIEDACLVFNFVLSVVKERKIQILVRRFIVRCLAVNLDHDDLGALYNLGQKLETEFQETASSAIKSVVLDTWKREISQFVADDSVLEEYLGPGEEGLAFDQVVDYVYNMLSNFDFSDDEILGISESVDIEDQISANREAIMGGGEDYESSVYLVRVSSENDRSLVDDLFQRE